MQNLQFTVNAYLEQTDCTISSFQGGQGEPGPLGPKGAPGDFVSVYELLILILILSTPAFLDTALKCK